MKKQPQLLDHRELPSSIWKMERSVLYTMGLEQADYRVIGEGIPGEIYKLFLVVKRIIQFE